MYAYVVGNIVPRPSTVAGSPPSRSRNARFAGISFSTICAWNRVSVVIASRSGAFPTMSPIARA